MTGTAASSLIIVVLVVAVPAAIIVAAVALAEVSALKKRLRALEERAGAPREIPREMESPWRGAAAPGREPPRPAAPPLGPPGQAAAPQPCSPVVTSPWPPSPPPAAPAPLPQPAQGPPPVEAAPGALPQAEMPRPVGRTPDAVVREPVRIDWERWIGLRGAAVLGAIALALAGLLFFQYSIQRGLITPPMRVAIGAVVGLACIGGSELIRFRGYKYTAEGLAGAGVVILYAAFWAAQALYALISIGPAFALMALVTVACCVLALRHSSQVVAVLGLVGGFATPILLRSEADRPIGLFGYVLLLNLGLLMVGHRRRWPWMSVLSLLGTVLIQGLWVGARMGPGRVTFGLIVLGMFAVLFSIAGQLSAGVSEKERGWWLASQAGGILLPFAFAIYFASRVDFGAHIYPLALLLLLLAGAAGWTGRAQRAPWVGVATASGCVAVIGVWMLRQELSVGLAWEAVSACCLLSLAFHVFVEWQREEPGINGPAPAAALAACAFSVLLILGVATSRAVPLWPWLAGWCVLAGLLYRHAAFPRRDHLQLAAALVAAAGLTVFHLAHHDSKGFSAPSFLAILFVASAVLQGLALLRREPAVRRMAQHSAGALPALLLFGLINAPILPAVPPGLMLGSALGLSALIALVGTRLGSGVWYAGGVALAAATQTNWSWSRPGLLASPESAGMAERAAAGGSPEAFAALGIQAATVIVFTAWPFFAQKGFSQERWAWRAAALAGPLWFMTLRELWSASLGDSVIGLLPLALGALALAGVARARVSWEAADPIRKSVLVWFSAVALGLLSAAIPLQLEKEWITIGWAVEGLAVAILWRRLDHPGLKWLALALFAGATARLVVNPFVLGYHLRSGWRIVNWLAYTYLVPASAFIGGWAALRILEVPRARQWERSVYSRGYPVAAILSALAGVGVVFMWINLAVFDWFATGRWLDYGAGRLPARDLTLSIAWAVFALVLLGFGMGWGSIGLRWLSLSFLLLTIGKVFLYDLGELRDLYRVLSLLGLAASLILVSLLYQRFVFRDRRA